MTLAIDRQLEAGHRRRLQPRNRRDDRRRRLDRDDHRAPRRRARARVHGRNARLARRQPADPPRLRAHPRARLAADADDSRGDQAHASTGSSRTRASSTSGRRHERHLQPRAAAREPRRRRNRPSLVLPRARRIPRRRGDRQVRLHAHPHRLPAAIPHEVLRASRRSTDPSEIRAPDPARVAAAPLERRPARGRVGRRRPGRDRAGLVGRVHRVPAQGAGARAARRPSRRGVWPRTPARSRSTSSSEPVGKQDQYVAAHGGICAYTFNTDGSVDVEPLELSRRTLDHLRNNLLLFYTGEARVRVRDPRRPGRSAPKRATTRCAPTSTGRRRSGIESRALLESGDLEQLRRADARALGEQASAARRAWRSKRIEHLYTLARRSGVDRRQARRRRRRRLPARLRATAGRHASGDGGGRRAELRFDFEFQGSYGVEYT